MPLRALGSSRRRMGRRWTQLGRWEKGVRTRVRVGAVRMKAWGRAGRVAGRSVMRRLRTATCRPRTAEVEGRRARRAARPAPMPPRGGPSCGTSRTRRHRWWVAGCGVWGHGVWGHGVWGHGVWGVGCALRRDVVLPLAEQLVSLLVSVPVRATSSQATLRRCLSHRPSYPNQCSAFCTPTAP